MLSIFPELLNFGQLGIFIVRVVVGLSLFYLSIQILDKKNIFISNKESKVRAYSVWILGSTALVSSGFMIIGFIIQISSIISAYLFLDILFLDKKNNVLGQSKIFYIIMAVICTSFIFLGPGIWSVDLPL